jgi:hypothetical protein
VEGLLIARILKLTRHTSHIIIRAIKFKNSKNKWSTNTQAKLSTMKYYKFSRKRKPYYYVYDPKSRKKSDYMINTGRSKILSGIFFENQAWGGLHKAWKGYVIAKNKDEYDNMERYARIIQENQYELGLEVSSFPNIGRSAASFYWQLAEEEYNIQEQQVPEEKIMMMSTTNKKGSPMNRVNILKTMKIKLKGSAMTIVKISQTS